jgi:hypothetical protein
MEKVEVYNDVVRLTHPKGYVFILFGIQKYYTPVRAWVLRLLTPKLSNQHKQLLLVHGAVKSGKTTLIKEALPYLLVQLQDGIDQFKDKTFCFAYIELSSLASLTSTEGKWKRFWSLLQKAFPGRMWVDQDNVVTWDAEVTKSLVALKDYGNAIMWFISLDEFHNLFSGLNANDVNNMAETAKHIFLDNDSPCYFLLGGSTQATFWSAVGKAKNNGLMMLRDAHVLTTPFQSSAAELKECCAALIALEVSSEGTVQEALAVLPPSQQTCVNLAQVLFPSAVGDNFRHVTHGLPCACSGGANDGAG